MLDQRLDAGHEGRRVGANNFIHLLTILEEEKSGHGADTKLASDFGEIVDIDLVEFGASILLAEPSKLRGNCLTRTTPLSEAVENDKVLGFDNLLLKILFAMEQLVTWVTEVTKKRETGVRNKLLFGVRAKEWSLTIRSSQHCPQTWWMKV